MSSSAWIGVDLDGTLAEYHGWQGIDHIGKPIPMMAERVRKWIKFGPEEVKIFTARVCRPQDGYTVEEIVSIIQDWTEDHFGVRLEVTNQKDFDMIELWDDRARQVEPNTGRTTLDILADSWYTGTP